MKQLITQQLHQRVEALSPAQRTLLAKKLRQLSKQEQKHSKTPSEIDNESSPQRLVAYILQSSNAKPSADHSNIDASDISLLKSHRLRAALKSTLPPYMVPAAIVPLTAFPYTANGKIDVKALPNVQSFLQTQPTATTSETGKPTTDTEKVLQQIWSTVLGVKKISTRDNFFELGGDSILSIQIVSKSREANIRIAPNQLFEHSTIAELAAAIDSNASPDAQNSPIQIEQSAVTGSLPLTPIQHWFFNQNMAASQHWHQTILLSLPHTISHQQVAQALTTLWQHHDALRLRFEKTTESGIPIWKQYNTDINHPPFPVCVDLSELSAEEQKQEVTAQSTQLHARTTLTQPDLLNAAYFFFGDQQPAWLLISLHHLAVDGISWQILKEDLHTLLSTDSALLPAKTTAFKTWAEALPKQVEARRLELELWIKQLSAPTLQLKNSHLLSKPVQQSKSTEGTAHTHTVALDSSATHSLLKKVSRAYNTQINDILLTALAKSLYTWTECHPTEEAEENQASKTVDLRIDLEAHGREQLSSNIDISRTVGWFTSVHPIHLSWNQTNSIKQTIQALKEQLRQIPDKGIGFGILRYLSDESTQQKLASFPNSEILFNYLGQQTVGEPSANSTDSIHSLEDVETGVLRDPRNSRSYLLDINAWVTSKQLHINWTYDTQHFTQEAIAQLAQTYLTNLHQIINHCLSVTRIGHTPSDFPDISFTQTELETLLNQLPYAKNQQKNSQQIESIYPLSPLQQAFLWHSLQSSSSAGLLHMRGTLQGKLNTTKLQQAWQLVMNHHPTLRTSIHWEQIPTPVQVVTKNPPISWQILDYRDQADPRQVIATFLAKDRALGFDFTHPPITRFTLIQTGDRTHELIWTSHHLTLDGWSSTLVINQLLTTYDALIQSITPTLPTAPSYQTYLHWLQHQNKTTAKQFWQSYLKNITVPTDLSSITGHSQSTPATKLVTKRSQSALSSKETKTLQTFLRTHRLTLNTLIQGAWALYLHHISNQTNILFGATISGRQVPIDNIDNIVGLLTNVVPVRANISPTTDILSWLQALQAKQTQASRYHHTDPTEIQTWSNCDQKLFNSLLVVENYPNTQTNLQSIQLQNLRSGIISTYDLTVIAKLENTLTIFVDAQTEHKATEATKSTETIPSALRAIINSITAQPEATTSQVLTSTDLPGSQPVQQLAQQTGKAITSSFIQNSPQTIEHPRTPLELKLIKIWETVLNLSPLSVTNSFFDLGGDSMLAVQLFNRMQEQLDHTPPLATLFQAPTIRKFAHYLNQQNNSSWSSLVPVQTSGTRIPLFFHGGSADALTWARFSHLLGPDQPFYALQRPDLDGSTIQELSVEDLAKICVQEIKTVQPEGPYLIGGHCFGGAVAFEIVKRLQTQGDTIASFIPIDAYCPNALPDSTTGRLQEQLQLSYFLLRKSYYYHGGRQLMQLPKKVYQRVKSYLPSTSTTQPETSNSSTAHTSTIAPESLTPYEERYAIAHQANIRAAEHYTPQTQQPITVPTQLFCASVQILDWRYGPDLGWQSVINSPLKKTITPGIFGNLFNQKSAPILAKQLNAYLSTIQQTNS